jgi:hypothetical protein
MRADLEADWPPRGFRATSPSLQTLTNNTHSIRPHAAFFFRGRILNSLPTTLYAFILLLSRRRKFSGRSFSQKHVHPYLILLIFRPSIVRFRLPLTPPHGTEMPPKSVLYQDVGTKDSSPDIPRFNRSASKWTKADLLLLGVDYQYRVFDDIQFGIEDADMPTELLDGNNLFVTG